MNYIFEEVSVFVNGIEYYATGSIDVDYEINRPDRSVGETNHWAEITDYSDLHATLVSADGEHPDIEDTEYDYKSDIGGQILEKIYDDICYACEDEYLN